MTGTASPALTSAVACACSLGHMRDLPQRFPLHGVAAALVVDRAGHERVEPVIVIDFYRRAKPL